jgi:uncharacterized damage-inducible protein DinB
MQRALTDAFGHHVWATLQVIDACLELDTAQLATEPPGTYGSIIATIRHVVGSDSWYLFDLTGDAARQVEHERMDLRELRAVMERDGIAWTELLGRDLDPDEVVTEIDEEDGFRRDAPIGVRLAQALHHGSEHRSQVCTALTTIGIEPPSIDVWDYALASGRSVETLAAY